MEDITGVSIIIPVLDQVHYTKICIESLRKTVPADVQTVIINNGSADGTTEYLKTVPDITVINNTENIGCAAAWNQGVHEARGAWIVILNNDVVLSPLWLEGLLDFAKEKNIDIVSPAFREGEYHYDIVTYSQSYRHRMSSVIRRGVAQGICFMVRRRVFDEIGLFDEHFEIGQFEDADFFRRAKNAGFSLGTTGRSFIHHFGSITQNSLRRDNDRRPYETKNRAYFREKWHLPWWKRFLERRYAKLCERWWRISEKFLYHHTLIEKFMDGKVQYY